MGAVALARYRGVCVEAVSGELPHGQLEHLRIRRQRVFHLQVELVVVAVVGDVVRDTRLGRTLTIHPPR